MKKKWIMAAMSVVFTASVLSACNGAGDEPEDVNYEPTRYQDENRGPDADMRGPGTDMRGPDVDTDPRDVRRPNEPDTPQNMDEEEPDPDEEPSEERRGM